MNDSQLGRSDTAVEPSRLMRRADLELQTVGGEKQHLGYRRDDAGLLVYWQAVRRHKVIVILMSVLGVLGATLVALAAPRIYQARTSLEIQSLNQEFLNMKSVNATLETGVGGLEADIQTQVKLLQSRVLSQRVLETIKTQPRPAHVQPANQLGVWQKALHLRPAQDDEIWDQAVRTAADGVRVRSSPGNHVIEISCDSLQPQVAAAYCNTLAQTFIEQNLESRWKSTEYTGQWLTRQLQDLKIKLERQQDELQSYASATHLVFADDKNDADVIRLSELQRELSVVQADRFAKQSKYEMTSTTAAGALPEVLDDASVKDSQRTLAELKAKLAQLNITYTANHVEVRRTQAQIDVIEGAIADTRNDVLTRIRQDFEAAKRRETLLVDAYARQVRLVSSKSEETAHYSLLKRDVDATRLMYETIQQRLEEARVASALRANNIRIVDPAGPPLAPYKPDVSQLLAFGLLLGVVSGVSFAVLRARTDRTLQDPGDLAYYLGLSELGVVPVGERNDVLSLRSAAAGLGLRAAVAGTAGITNGAGKIERVSWDQRTSILSEAFRTTLASILFSRRNSAAPQVIVLTSASSREGKTTIVTNLGIAMAQLNQRVLLIDGDMRRPRVHWVFDCENECGLSEVLADTIPVDLERLKTACQATSIPGLYVLTSGSQRSQPSNLVHSPRLAELIRLAREQFDTIIIDTPPTVNVADARAFARVADGLILVVRSGSTTRDAALLAKSQIVADGTPVLGTILSFWNPNTPGYGHYPYSQSGYYDGQSDQDGRAENGTRVDRRQAARNSTTDFWVDLNGDVSVAPTKFRAARTAAMERWIQAGRERT